MLCDICNENRAEYYSCGRCHYEWCSRCHSELIRTGKSSEWGKIYKCPYCRFTYVEKSKILQPVRLGTKSSTCSIL